MVGEQLEVEFGEGVARYLEQQNRRRGQAMLDNLLHEPNATELARLVEHKRSHPAG